MLLKAKYGQIVSVFTVRSTAKQGDFSLSSETKTTRRLLENGVDYLTPHLTGRLKQKTGLGLRMWMAMHHQ